MKYTDKFLTSIPVLGLIGFTIPAFAEPNILSDDSVETFILLTPDFDVDISEFSKTGDINSCKYATR